MILEWPRPQVDQDWESGRHQWHEITPIAYREMQAIGSLREKTDDAFMQSNPVDILANGDGLYVCCKRENGFYFARLLPSEDWWKRDYMPLPETGTLASKLF